MEAASLEAKGLFLMCCLPVWVGPRVAARGSFAVLLSREMGFDPGVFGHFDLAALVQPHLGFLFVGLFHG